MKVTAVDYEGKEHEVDAADLVWRPSIYGIVVRDGEILLSEQTNGFELPGGGIEMGELLDAAVEREVKEETGINVRFKEVIGVESNFYKPHHSDIGEKTFQSILIYTVCEYIDGDISSDGYNEYEKEYLYEAKWVDLSKLDELEIGSSIDWRMQVRKCL